MAIAGGVGILGAFLPWLSLSGGAAGFVKAMLEAQGESLSGIGRDGNLTIVLAIVAAVMGGVRLAGKAPKGAPTTGLVVGALITLIAIYDIADVGSVSDSLAQESGDGLYGSMIDLQVSVGIGLWLTLVAGIAVVVTSILALRSNNAT